MRRLFLIDPVCALPYGHNINALHYYHRYFKTSGLEVRAFASRLLPERLTKGSIEREFSFLYDDVINVGDLVSDAERDTMRAIRSPQDKIAIAAGEMRAFLEVFNLGPDDAVFFPSIDFYSLLGFIVATSGETGRRPQLWARFIGVLEHHAEGYAEPRRRMMSELRRYAHAHPDSVRLSAETGALAEIMSAELGVPVETAPYPLSHDPVPMTMDGPLVVLAAGAARFDKGYLRLRAIYNEMARQVPLGDFELVIQSPPDSVLAQSLDHTAELCRLPHVNMLPAVLSQELVEDCYRNAHVVMMPYEPSVYRERGSAVMQEAVSFGRYVVGQRGTGFAQQITTYGVGLLAQTDLDFGVQLGRIAALPRKRLAEIATEGRARYAADTQRVYREWLQ